MPEEDNPNGSEEQEQAPDIEDVSTEDLAREVMEGLDEEAELVDDQPEEPEQSPPEETESISENSDEEAESGGEAGEEVDSTPVPDPEDSDEDIADSVENDSADSAVPPESEEGGGEAVAAGREAEDIEAGEGAAEETDSESDEEAEVAEESEEELDEPEEAGETEGSIKEILDREATRSQAAEEEEEQEGEAELPGGYLAADQLPEEEEVAVPPWLKKTGRYGLIALLIIVFLRYVLLPGLEALLTARISSALDEEAFYSAKIYSRIGMFANGILIRDYEEFRADYLHQLLARQEFGRFIDEYDHLISDPDPYARQIYTQYLINQGRWSEALKQVEELQIAYKTRGIGYLLEVRARMELEEYEEAQNALERAWRELPGNVELDRLERDLALRLNELDRAAAAGKRVIEAFAGDENIEERASDYARLGEIAERREAFHTAEDNYLRALQNDRFHREALTFLVRHFTLEKRWSRSRDFLTGETLETTYRRLYPLNPLGWWATAELMLVDDRLAEAIVLLERGKEVDPREPEIHRLLGMIYLDQFQRPAQGVFHLEEARRFGLARDNFLNYLARAYFANEQFLSAAELYEDMRRTIDVVPAALWYNIASCYLGAGELDLAEEYLEQAYEEGYRESQFYTQSGLIYELRGQLQQALARYMEGVEIMEREEEDVEHLRRNLNRALSRQPVRPLTEWLAPLEKEF